MPIFGSMKTIEHISRPWQGFASGAVSSLVCSSIGVACAKSCSVQWQRAAMIAGGALAGGVSATIAGGNFWDGVCNGLICAGLNHAMHLTCEAMSGPDDPPKKKANLISRKITQAKAEYELMNIGVGAKIASYAGSEFNQRMFWQYWLGKGDYTLTPEEFVDILSVGTMVGTPAKIQLEGQTVITQQISLYDTEYNNSIGTGTVILNDTGSPIGFYDKYDFNIFGATRSMEAQFKTIMIKSASTFNVHSKPYKIKYP